MSKLKIPWIVASAVVVAILVMVAGLSIGQVAPAEAPAAPAAPAGPEAGIPQLYLSDIEPLGDNEHFGLANVGTATVDLGSFSVVIDKKPKLSLPAYPIKAGEEVNLLFTPGTSANEPGEKDLYLPESGLTLDDDASRIALMDSSGVVRSELTYNNLPHELTALESPAAPAK